MSSYPDYTAADEDVVHVALAFSDLVNSEGCVCT